MQTQTKTLINEIAHARILLVAIKDKLDDVSEEMFYDKEMGALDVHVMNELTDLKCDIGNMIARSNKVIKKRTEMENQDRVNELVQSIK